MSNYQIAVNILFGVVYFIVKLGWSIPEGIFLMFLWNFSMPIVFGLPYINWMQAIALVLIFNILVKPSNSIAMLEHKQ